MELSDIMTKEKEMSKTARKSKILEVVEEVVEQPMVERVRPPKDEKGRYKEVDMSMEELEKLNLKTKSAVIRYLASQGYAPAAIAKFLGIIYQHVRNVLTKELKRPTTPQNKEGGE
jgi:predicted DNA-binding protein (UPF0251 family)